MWCAGGKSSQESDQVEKKNTGEIVTNKAEAAKMLEAQNHVVHMPDPDPWRTHADLEREASEQAQTQTQDHLIMQAFRDYIGPFLMRKPVKVTNQTTSYVYILGGVVPAS